MKIKNIIISGLGVMALTACNDYLNVDPTSTNNSPELVFSNETEVNTALNGVYVNILGDNTFGADLYNALQLNSDVDFATNSSETANGNQPRRFDVRTDASSVSKLWNALYTGIESANEFIYNLNKSGLYKEDMEVSEDKKDTTYVANDYSQMMGEAKMIRAMLYHELLSYYGDVPFSFQATYETNNPVLPVTNREEISKALIQDLQHAAKFMKSDSEITDAPRRISQEAVYAMIARLALQAGGYSLHPSEKSKYGEMKRPVNYKDYYKIAMDYAEKLIDSNKHHLKKDFVTVFVNECNNNTDREDDIIFEIPFTKEQNGAWGYNQGPASNVDAESEDTGLNGQWGKTGGGVRVTHMYRYQFAEGDARRDYVCGLVSYDNYGVPSVSNNYTLYNNKWSKLWNLTGYGKSTTSSTGIGFGYIRYTDVLLMYAEAANEYYDGPTDKAKDALKEVRERAFKNAANHDEMVNDYVNYLTTKEDFLQAVLDERKFEFAGENMRWKDLVRNNMYGETLYYTFLTYLAMAQSHSGASSYMDYVCDRDGIRYDELPTEIFYCSVDNYANPNFPNNTLYSVYIVNPFNATTPPKPTKPKEYMEANGLSYVPKTDRDITGISTSSNTQEFKSAVTNWINTDGSVKNEILYSLYGFIRGDQNENVNVVDNATLKRINAGVAFDTKNLPVVRYMLPYPEEAIKRSNGVYHNNYGY